MSFWDPRKALGLALVLFIILEYIFSLIAFAAFSEDYQGNCETTYDCFLYTFDYTFKANGGIGGQLDEIYERTGKTKSFLALLTPSQLDHMQLEDSYSIICLICFLLSL